MADKCFFPCVCRLSAFTCTTVQPVWSSLDDSSVIAIYTLGSGICGGAKNGATLIAGRAVQAIGSGGIIQGQGKR